MTIKPHEYQCHACNGVYSEGWSKAWFKAWTEEERLNESKKLFGDIPEHERVIVCDDCFKQITSRPEFEEWCKQSLEMYGSK